MQDSDKFTYSKSIRIIVKLSCRIFDILHRTEQDRVWSKLRRWLMCMREKLAGRCWSKCQVQRKLWQSWSPLDHAAAISGWLMVSVTHSPDLDQGETIREFLVLITK